MHRIAAGAAVAFCAVWRAVDGSGAGARLRGVARRHPVAVDAAAVTAVALVARLALVLCSAGGFTGYVGYDQSVYYAAADALTGGRVPYRDFTLLHPPALMVALTPFAALGRWAGDLTGFVLADVAWTLLAALCAGLVVVVARRAGLSRPAALLGGLLYATWYTVANAEYSVRLEPLGNLLLLAALAVLGGPGRSRRRAALAGALLGCAVATKIWWAAPVLVVLGWQAWSRQTRWRLAPMLAGLAGAGLLLVGPFLALAPGPMLRMVVLDQLHRPTRLSTTTRLQYLLAPATGRHGLPGGALTALIAAGVALGAVLLVLAWRVPAGRPFAVLTVVQLAVLLRSPSFFLYYGSSLGPAAALTLAAAAHVGRGGGARRWRPALAALAVAAAAGSTAVALVDGQAGSAVPTFPRHAVAARLSGVRCLMTDSQQVLIALDRLSRQLDAGCPDYVDVIGRVYGVDSDPAIRSRRFNPRYQQDMRRYLLSGDAVLLANGQVRLDRAGRRALLARDRDRTRIGAVVLYTRRGRDERRT